MKTPTKKQLQELSVRALGEGATVDILELVPDYFRARAWAAAEEHRVYRDSYDESAVALAAALEALAEVRK